MSEQKHTPGPWIVTTELRQDDEIVCDMLNEQGYVAIAKGQQLGHWRDDAKLIATAPDLLADLIAAAVTLRHYEALHRAKGTAESLEKANVNAVLASRFEQTIAKATQ